MVMRMISYSTRRAGLSQELDGVVGGVGGMVGGLQVVDFLPSHQRFERIYFINDRIAIGFEGENDVEV